MTPGWVMAPILQRENILAIHKTEQSPRWAEMSSEPQATLDFRTWLMQSQNKLKNQAHLEVIRNMFHTAEEHTCHETRELEKNHTLSCQYFGRRHDFCVSVPFWNLWGEKKLYPPAGNLCPSPEDCGGPWGTCWDSRAGLGLARRAG